MLKRFFVTEEEASLVVIASTTSRTRGSAPARPRRSARAFRSGSFSCPKQVGEPGFQQIDLIRTDDQAGASLQQAGQRRERGVCSMALSFGRYPAIVPVA